MPLMGLPPVLESVAGSRVFGYVGLIALSGWNGWHLGAVLIRLLMGPIIVLSSSSGI